MATFALTCVGCGEGFEAKTSRAKWCSPACKKRRQRKPEESAEPTPTEIEPADTGLVDAVRRELAAADRLDTVHGQMALQLARKMTAVDATGVAGLSKELDRVRGLALEGYEPPAPEDTKPAPEPPEDEVEAARRRRQEKAEAAAAAAAVKPKSTAKRKPRSKRS